MFYFETLSFIYVYAVAVHSKWIWLVPLVLLLLPLLILLLCARCFFFCVCECGQRQVNKFRRMDNAIGMLVIWVIWKMVKGSVVNVEL